MLSLLLAPPWRLLQGVRVYVIWAGLIASVCFALAWFLAEIRIRELNNSLELLDIAFGASSESADLLAMENRRLRDEVKKHQSCCKMTRIDRDALREEVLAASNALPRNFHQEAPLNVRIKRLVDEWMHPGAPGGRFDP
jgi:hypothetical protein